MTQKWWTKASVQAALIGGLCLISAALIPVALKVPGLHEENERLKSLVQQKTAEIQRLEVLLTPFKTIALQRFTGPESEALVKLAERIKMLDGTLEQTKKELEVVRATAASHDFKPLRSEISQAISSELRARMQQAIRSGMQIPGGTNFSVRIQYQTGSQNRALVAEQLITVLRDAGIRTSGPQGCSFFPGERVPKHVALGMHPDEIAFVSWFVPPLNRYLTGVEYEGTKQEKGGPLSILILADPIFQESGLVRFR